MMANAAMTPAMKTPLMMLELASPEDGATEPQTSRPREFRTWLADSREAEPCGNPSGSSLPIIEELINFHDHTLIIVFLISSLVLYIISLILTTKLTHTSTIDAQEVETI